MSTKTQIQTLINNNLADGSSITASEHRAVEDSLLNELYPTNIYETQSSNIKTSENTNAPFNTVYGYEVNIVKQGNLVTMTGKIKNLGTSIYGIGANTWFFEIVDTEFQQKLSIPSVIGFVRGDVYGRYVVLQNNRLFCNSLAGYSELDFQLTYTTQN